MASRDAQGSALQDRVEAVLGPQFADLRLLQVGGSASVFLGTNRTLGRVDAIKVITWEHCDSPRELARFRREWEALAKLNHPHVITIHDAAIDESACLAYMVQEYLRDGTLATRLRAGPLSLEEGLRVSAALAEGLAHAHDHEILHRDLKPENILFGDDGHVVLADFGIAHQIGADRLTRAAGVVGTPAYMSPEQLRGEEPTPTSDLFSLGLVFYEIFTGLQLFRGRDTASIIEQHRRGRRRKPQAVRPDLPADLGELILALLNDEASQRPPSAREVARRLDTIRSRCVLSGQGKEPTTHRAADPAGGTASRSPHSARRRAILLSGAGLVILVSILLIGGWPIPLLHGVRDPGPEAASHVQRAGAADDATDPAAETLEAPEPGAEGDRQAALRDEPLPGRSREAHPPTHTGPIECRLHLELTGSQDLISRANHLTVTIDGFQHAPGVERNFTVRGRPGDTLRVRVEQPGLRFHPPERAVAIPESPGTIPATFQLGIGPGDR